MVKQAPVLLQSHLSTIIAHLKTQLQISRDQKKRITLARDIVVFTVAFGTTKGEDELARTLIERILRLPNDSGLLFSFQWSKTLRSRADHFMAVPYIEKHLATCPVRAVEQLIEVGKHFGWDMTSGYFFPTIESATERKGKPVRGKGPITALQMSLNLKQYASEAGERTDSRCIHSGRGEPCRER